MALFRSGVYPQIIITMVIGIKDNSRNTYKNRILCDRNTVADVTPINKLSWNAGVFIISFLREILTDKIIIKANKDKVVDNISVVVHIYDIIVFVCVAIITICLT